MVDDQEGMQKAIEAAADEFFGYKAMSLLLENHEIEITEPVVKAAAANERSGGEVMAVLLEKKGDHINLTENVVKAAASNKRSGEEVMALLLDKKGDKVQVTEGMFMAAASSKWTGENVLNLLLKRNRKQSSISEDLASLIAKEFSASSMALLLEKTGNQIITEKLIRAAASNERNGGQVMALLLDKKGYKVQITEEVFKAAASNEGCGKEVMDLLLDKKGDEVRITEEVVEAAASNRWSGGEVMALLLDKKGDKVQVTEGVVEAAASNRWSGEEVMALLLDKKGDKVQVTEEVIKAAASNERCGEEVMALLLDKKGENIQVTEGVVKAAASNKRCGEDVMALLLDEKGDEVRITEEVVEAAASNRWSGGEVMALLLDKRGGEVQVTEEVVKAAASNGGCGKEVMALLLDKKGDKVQVTEEVIKAAANNERCGKEVMALLLDKKGDEVQVTEGVVKAAASNKRCGEEVMALLLHKRSDVKVTEEVIRAAGNNKQSGIKVLALLEIFDASTNGKICEEHTWIQDLRTLGYRFTEIADLLLGSSRDYPWVYFQPTKVPRYEIQSGLHALECVHSPSIRTSGSTRNSETLLMQNHQPPITDQNDFIGLIEELCGLAGLSPESRATADMVGSANFADNYQAVAVSYVLSSDELGEINFEGSISRISRVLERFCSAAGFMQAKNLCCNCVTVLRSRGYHHSAPDVLPGELIPVEFQLVIQLAEAIRSAQESKLEVSSLEAIQSASQAILNLVGPELSTTPTDSFIQWCIHLCALTVQFLCLGLLSFTQAHIGPIKPFFLETPIRRVTMLGFSRNKSSPHLVAELTELTCLSGMTREPVWMFYSSSDKNFTQSRPRTSEQDQQTMKKHDIIGHVSDVLDTWGPGYLVYANHAGNAPIAIKIGDGFVFADESGKCHWAQELGDVSKLNAINLEAPLVIGNTVMRNETCSVDQTECWRTAQRSLGYLGTSTSSWELSERQGGLQVGQYAVGQLVGTWKKQKGISAKEVALANPNDVLLLYMDEYWGVQVSYCTGVAKRVLLRTLVADLLPLFFESSSVEFSAVVSRLKDESSTLPQLQSWLRSLNEVSRKQVLTAIGSILHTLRPTGLNSTKKCFCVAWPFENDIIRCFDIPSEDSDTWARILADSHDCATFAYITMDCLQTHHIRCSGSPEGFNRTVSLLETAVICTEQDTSFSPPFLRHDGVYFFSKLDSNIWVKVQREHGDQQARLVELRALRSMPYDIRQRFYASERKKQRARLRERHTVSIQGEIVSVDST